MHTHAPVHGRRSVAALADGPHHEALPAAAVTRSKHAGDGRGKLAPLGLWWALVSAEWLAGWLAGRVVAWLLVLIRVRRVRLVSPRARGRAHSRVLS
jgi:hypothetical protein